jgi:hypothetical protein
MAVMAQDVQRCQRLARWSLGTMCVAGLVFLTAKGVVCSKGMGISLPSVLRLGAAKMPLYPLVVRAGFPHTVTIAVRNHQMQNGQGVIPQHIWIKCCGVSILSDSASHSAGETGCTCHGAMYAFWASAVPQ